MREISSTIATILVANILIDDFVISGASKRGWTTWLVGIVDKRVIGMMPYLGKRP